MGKKFIISEDERNRILGLHETAKNNYGTVISEQYAGVAFGAEQNGLRIKKVEATEQVVPAKPAAKPATNQTGLTPQQQLKPTYEDGGIKYYVPNLTDVSWDKFSNVLRDTTMNMDGNAVRKYFENTLGVKPIGTSPFGVPDERYKYDLEMVQQNRENGLGIDDHFKNAPYAGAMASLQRIIGSSLSPYLKYWRPSITGMNVLQNRAFLSDPAIVDLKKYISNFNEVYPKLINMAAKNSGLQIG